MPTLVRDPRRLVLQASVLVASIFGLHCGTAEDPPEVDTHSLDSQDLGARRVLRLGESLDYDFRDASPDAPEYATVAMTTKRVLSSKSSTTTIQVDDLPRSRLIFAAATRSDLAEPISCSVTRGAPGQAPALVAQLQLPAGPPAWVEVEV